MKRSQPKRKSFNNLLTDCLVQSDRSSGFDVESFFVRWFREEGTSHFFLFKKNLSVTNIQHAELFALLRSNCFTGSRRKSLEQVLFLTTAEFEEGVRGLLSSFRGGTSSKRKRCEFVARTYGSMFRRTIVLDPFFGSAAVFLPPTVSVDLRKICMLSGYIHSCGRNVFTRKLGNATKQAFIDSVKGHLGEFPSSGKPIFCAPYAHEDFTSADRELAEELRGGLDEVKLHVEKFYMGDDALVSVFNDLQQVLGDQVVVPPPGDFRRLHPKVREGTDPDRTIWLIVDASIEVIPQHKGRERYFICYDQLFANENPFHLFDENKPAWHAHTTIPHTLMGAMINLTLPMWRTRKKVVLGDPFVGSGTTALEALKYANIEAHCSDLDPASRQLLHDNLYFIGADASELEEYRDVLKSIPDWLQVQGPSSPVERSEHLRRYEWVRRFLQRNSHRAMNNILFSSGALRQQFAREDGVTRLLLYVALRTMIRHATAFRRGSQSWLHAFRTEADVLAAQLDRLSRLRRRQDAPSAIRRNHGTVCTGNYSRSCTLGLEGLKRLSTRRSVGQMVQVRNAKALTGNRFDVIVTDPPYGFNTESDEVDLATLYGEFIRVLIRSLKREGQLVICLPEESHSGRGIPYFVQSEIVTAQVIMTASELGKEVSSSGYSVPYPNKNFRPPYYWESERALRRSILHFLIRTKQGQ